MILGANQPYFLPYLGYFQLINAVDVFLIADDFQYIRHGWINRNRILRDGKIVYLKLPLIHPSQNKPINAHKICGSPQALDRVVEAAYRHAPCFKDVFPIFREITSYTDDDLAGFLVHSIKLICRYLEIDTQIILNSSRKIETSLKKQERIVEMNLQMGATKYINAIGGREIYSKERFLQSGIKLEFLQSGLPPYKQMRTQEFVPALSILDIMMNVKQEYVKRMLADYQLV